jgi:hypothetical protein
MYFCTANYEQIGHSERRALNFSQAPRDLVAVPRFGPRQFGFPLAVHEEFHPVETQFGRASLFACSQGTKKCFSL